MLVRDHVREKLERLEPGDEVEVIWNDAVMIESRYQQDLFADNPVLKEKARALMRHRGIMIKIEELEAGHYVLFLYIKKGSRVMLPRRNGAQYVRANNHILVVIPVALISDIKLLKKGKEKITGLMQYQVIEAQYRVKSVMPRLRLK